MEKCVKSMEKCVFL